MPLITCPECGKQVSDQATSCPHCGYPLTPAKKEEPRKHNANPDFSKMEVIMYRGSTQAIAAGIIVLALCFTLIGLGVLVVWKFEEILRLIFAVLLFGFSVPLFIAAIVQTVKGCNNTKIKTDCLYYDNEEGVFYLSTWQRTIIAVNARDEFRVGLNKRGYGEAIGVHQGRRINLGFSKTNVYVANQRVQQIRSTIR